MLPPPPAGPGPARTAVASAAGGRAASTFGAGVTFRKSRTLSIPPSPQHGGSRADAATALSSPRGGEATWSGPADGVEGSAQRSRVTAARKTRASPLNSLLTPERVPFLAVPRPQGLETSRGK